MQRTTPIGAIGEFLEAQQGVRRAQVDAAVERVTVDYNARLTCPEELAYIMEESGYLAVLLPSEDEGEAGGPAMYRQQDVSLHPFSVFSYRRSSAPPRWRRTRSNSF